MCSDYAVGQLMYTTSTQQRGRAFYIRPTQRRAGLCEKEKKQNWHNNIFLFESTSLSLKVDAGIQANSEASGFLFLINFCFWKIWGEGKVIFFGKSFSMQGRTESCRG